MAYDIIIGRNESDKEKFAERGLVFIGKGYVKMGNYTSLSNKIWLDVARSHVILIAGKRGCLTGATQIFTNKGYKKIKDYNAKEDKILSFNTETKKFEWENAELLVYPVSKESLLELELDDGRTITLTKEHPLLLNYGKYHFWRQAQSIKIRDKIILPTRLPENKKEKESVRIARILGFVLSDGTISKRKGKWKDGRGYWYNGVKSRLRIFCDDESVLSVSKKDLEDEFGLYTKVYKRNDCNCSVVQSLHAKVVDKINLLGVPLGNKSGIIRVPQVVWESSNNFKSNFLSALFSCDGHISKTGRYIDYSSKSKEFLMDLQLLLTHFNIESSIRVKNAKLNGKIYKNYRLFITDNSSVENFKKIGFISKFKQERLEKHKSDLTKKRKTFYPSDNLVCKRVKSIKEVTGITDVYDLSVNKNHSFIANGIISHNSGKSYSLGAIAEELSNLPPEAARNIAPIIFDTMGIFWTMKYKNEKDKPLLEKWALETKNLPVKIFVPFGKEVDYREKNIPFDKTFALKASELNAEDWITIFNLQMTSLTGVLLSRVIAKLQETKHSFTLDDIQSAIHSDRESNKDTKEIVSSLFLAAATWGIFSTSKEGTEISDLVNAGKTTILDVSIYSSVGAFNVRALVISLISRKLFNTRMDARKKEELEALQHGQDYLAYKTTRKEPLVWIFIDEAHEFLPRDDKTPATDALVQILREGRQPGISLVLATQQPGQIHKDVMTQSDIVIAHRLTAQPDIESLNQIMQTYLLANIKQQIDDLPRETGAAIILDDNSERIYPVRMRPRFTWHGGEAPTAVKADLQL
jgi:intein/homing endonuclease